MIVERAPGPALREHVTAYYGFEDPTERPVRRREGPGGDVVLMLSFGHRWLIDGERRTSCVGGLRSGQVTTESSGRSRGIHVGLVPWAAHALLGVPMHELADTTVALEDLLPGELEARLEAAPGWPERFDLLDELLARRLADARPSSPGVVWAWERLRDTHGRARVGDLAAELGWSRKRLVARFREEIGLAPKATARLLRFERARSLAGSAAWGEIAYECGFADQPHLIAEFRSFTGRTPETFLQDVQQAAA
jgi:AraC-like DNA-binding protein